jgi:hypothetical protein
MKNKEIKDYTKSTENMVNTINAIKLNLSGNLCHKLQSDFLELPDLFAHLQNLIVWDQDLLLSMESRVKISRGELSYDEYLKNMFERRIEKKSFLHKFRVFISKKLSI